MKTVSANARQYLSQATGNDPIIVVGIEWMLGNIQWYATRSLDSGIGNFTANIIDLGSIRVQTKTDNTSTCGSVTVTFDDSDGQMKSYIDNEIIEKAPAWIYLGFVGMAPADYVLLFQGVTVGPAKWSEGVRHVTFDLELVVDSHELGYSATIQDFKDINPEAQGIPWPIIFGTCAHVPALHIRRHAEGRLQCSCRFYVEKPYTVNQNSNDLTLTDNPDVFSFLLDANPLKNVLYIENGENFPQGVPVQIMIDDVVFQGRFLGTSFIVEKSNLPKYSDISIDHRGSDNDAKNYNVLWIKADSSGTIPNISNSYCYFYAPNKIEWYNKCIKQDGAKCWFRYPFVSPMSLKPKLMNFGDSITSVYGISKNGMAQDIAGMIYEAKLKMKWRRAMKGKLPFGTLITQIKNLVSRASCWWTAYADASVRLWNEMDPDIYIASLLTMKSITAVFGKRTVEGQDGKTRKIFVQIPESYYQIQYASNFPVHSEEPGAPDFYPTGVLFFKPLCDYPGQNWDDEIWVSGTSSIGPNPIDILQWVFTKFSNLAIDFGSFAEAKSRTNALKANFAIFEKRSALKFAEDVSLQCRCGLVLDSGAAKLVYLPLPPATVASFDESYIEMKSLEMSCTPTQDVITKLVASWSESYRDKHRLAEVRELLTREFEHILSSLIKEDRRTRSDTRYLVYRNNIGLYGLHTREVSCFIFNDEDSIAKFLSFWGYRWSNSWRLAKINVPLMGAMLQPYDGVVIQFTQDYITQGLSAVLGVVDSVELNYHELSVSLTLWLPVVIGTDFINSLGAWPG